MSKIVSDKNTVHIALATYPQNQSQEYVEDIKKYYEGFKDRIKGNFAKDSETDYVKHYKNLYDPLVYHLFGNYDVAFISLVDSYKFSQKIFLPKVSDKSTTDSKKDSYNPNSYQILTGISLLEEGTSALVKTYDSIKGKNYLGIINLKLNNGLYIGTGLDLFNSVCKKIIDILKEYNPKADNFIINQSFSWFELTILLFDDKHQNIPEFIAKLRSLKLSDLENWEDLANDTLYKMLEERKDIRESHVFIDTNSYFGVNYDSFTQGKLNNINDLKTHVELQIKPGHYHQVYNKIKSMGLDLLKSHRNSRSFKSNSKTKSCSINYTEGFRLVLKKENRVSNPKVSFLIGKNDFLLQFRDKGLDSNYKLYQSIRQDDGIGKYVKRIKTVVLSDCLSEGKSESKDLLDWTVSLKNLSYSHLALEQIENFLLELKVSRQIREKIVKILFNYNSGILDRVMFTYFLDFTIFLRNFVSTIVSDYLYFKYCFVSKRLVEQEVSVDPKASETKKITEKTFKEITDSLLKAEGLNNDMVWENFLKKEIKKFNKDKTFYTQGDYTFKDIKTLEIQYKTMITAFEEGYHLRLLNGYVFEEMYDLDVDFNSSIQQLLTSYNTIVAEMANYYYSERYSSGMLVQLNLQSTVSNDISINYNSYHLTAPEFVFFTLEKEILNPFTKNNIATLNLKKFQKHILTKILETLNDKFLDDLAKKKHIDLNYLFIDYSRFMLSCNSDEKLFEYWFWTYNFQNSAMYDSIGKLKEENFERELFRLFLVLGLEDEKYMDNLKCPIPELFPLWNKYFFKYKEKAKILLRSLLREGFKEEIVTRIYDDLSDDELNKDCLNKQTKELIEKSIGEYLNYNKDWSSKNLNLINYSLFNLYKKAILNAVSSEIELDYNQYSVLKAGMKVYVDKLQIGKRERYNVFYHCLIYCYLKLIYEKNGGMIRLLRRNWETGKPIQKFLDIDKDEDFLFYTEQLGGTFHAHVKKLNEYFILGNSVIQTVFHLGAVKKKDIIKHFISNG